MTRILSFLFSALISVFLFNCGNKSENRQTAENPGMVGEVKNDSLSEVKTDSVTSPENEPATEITSTVNPDSAEFTKVLTFKNITFRVEARGKGSLQQVSVKPAGLTATNQIEKLETEPVVNAEVADLNNDGYPELLIFTRSAGSGSYGNVIAFSVNNGKSMSRVTFPETSENSSLKKGYGGHDKFAIVNNTLTQEFPVYNAGDANSQPTGRKKIVTYTLKNGEASRIFVVDQVKEIPVK